MPNTMEAPKIQQAGQWARTVMSKKENAVRSPTCKFNPLVRKSLKQPCPTRQLKTPKCYIKITGSRYNGTFLLNIDDGLDDAIFHTMRDIEVALEEQADPMGKPKVCPKNCLSSVFRCFGTTDLQTKGVCNKNKTQKSTNKPAECSLTATINKSDLVPLINAVQSNSLNPSPEISSENVMRDVVDVFRTTVDQFCRENLNSFEVPSSPLLAQLSNKLSSKPSSPVNTIKSEAIDRSNQSNEELKKVAFIKFSQEEVLVIQPPKPSNNDTKELEVGIEVKPRTTASNVGQSIKLAKDKVLIGMQDGRGVLQINEGIPKRSLHMVIEEGANGKPLMKLSLNEEDQDQEIPPTIEHHHTDGVKHQEHKEKFQKTYSNIKYDENKNVSRIANNNESIVKNRVLGTLKNYRSVESQVTWEQLKDTPSSNMPKFTSESTQYQDPSLVQPSSAISHSVCCSVGTNTESSVVNALYQHSDMHRQSVSIPASFNEDPYLSTKKNSHNNRTPYLVHTLYEPRSLYNSSAYFASGNPSTHYGLIDKSPICQSRKQIKKPKSFTFSSDYSSSSKCTKIFRDIAEIREKDKKDASMTASLIDDFEQILQNLCGSSYLHHHPNPPESKPSMGPKHHETVLKTTNRSSASMSFDQWTQTQSSAVEFQACLDPIKKSNIRKNKKAKVRESGDGSHSKVSSQKDSITRSNATPQYAASSMSASTSGPEDGLSSDSSKENQHKLVFSMFAASDDNRFERKRSELTGKNWINGKAKSFVGQKIFDAIEDHTKLPESIDDIKETDSFVYPACKDASSKEILQGRSNVSVAVNVALYDGPTEPSSTQRNNEDPAGVRIIDESATTALRKSVINPAETEEQWHYNIPLQTTYNKSTFPICVKSKSCQNLLSATSSRTMENGVNGVKRKQGKKLRYPQLTATDSQHASILNVCGILNFNEGEMLTNDKSLFMFENLNPKVDEQTLPSAVRSLLLPRQRSMILKNNATRVPTFCCNPEDGYWEWETSQHVNDWGTTNEAFESVETVAVRRGIFKRTFFAMKNVRSVVTRKFSNIFRKLSITHAEKKKENSAMNDRLVYVAVPLKKKSENLHLYPRSQ